MVMTRFILRGLSKIHISYLHIATETVLFVAFRQQVSYAIVHISEETEDSVNENKHANG